MMEERIVYVKETLHYTPFLDSYIHWFVTRRMRQEKKKDISRRSCYHYHHHRHRHRHRHRRRRSS